MSFDATQRDGIIWKSILSPTPSTSKIISWREIEAKIELVARATSDGEAARVNIRDEKM